MGGFGAGGGAAAAPKRPANDKADKREREKVQRAEQRVRKYDVGKLLGCVCACMHVGGWVCVRLCICVCVRVRVCVLVHASASDVMHLHYRQFHGREHTDKFAACTHTKATGAHVHIH
jgi:hypothetical protein